MENYEKKQPYMNSQYKNILFILLVLGLTLYFFIDLEDLRALPELFLRLNKVYLFLGLLVMAIFFVCQALVIKRLLFSLGYKIKLSQGLRYTLIDYYFSAITPGAVGGQPSEIYYMKKDGINIGSSSLVMLIFNGLYHLSLVIVVGGFAIFYKGQVLQGERIFSYLFYFGLLAQISLSVGFFILIFSKKIIYKVKDFIIKILSKVGYKKVEKLDKRLSLIIEEYKKGSSFIYENKKIILQVFPLVILHIFLFYSTSYFVAKSFNLNVSLLEITAYQGIFVATFESLPLPGGVGLAETGFLKIFSKIYTHDTLALALLITRGLTYYVFLTVGCLVTFLTKGERAKKRSYEFWNNQIETI